MVSGALWGFVGGAALLVGAVIGVYLGAAKKLVALVMALGVGVLISSVAFELVGEAYRSGGSDSSSIGLLAGASLFFGADYLVNRGGEVVGIVTTVGFLLAFILSQLE